MDFARLCAPGLRGLTLGLRARHLALFATVIRYIFQRMQILLCLYGPSMLADRQISCRVIYNQLSFIGFAEISVWFFSAYHWSQSIGSPRMTPVSFVKTTESCMVSLVNIKRQTSYDSGIHGQGYGIIRQDYGIIRGLSIGSPYGYYIY